MPDNKRVKYLPENYLQVVQQLEQLLTPAIAIDWSRSHKYLLNGICYIGGYNEVNSDVTYAIHELGHLIEIDDQRLVGEPVGWGFKYGTWTDFPYHRSGGWYTRKTKQHIDRELRVMAIAYNLQQHFGIPQPFSELVEDAWYIPDIEHWYKGTKKEVLGAIASEVEYNTTLYPLDWIFQELQRKQDIILLCSLEN